ncbi:hypothetical protein A5881_003862 [Enterococcus termitis]
MNFRKSSMMIFSEKNSRLFKYVCLILLPVGFKMQDVEAAVVINDSNILEQYNLFSNIPERVMYNTKKNTNYQELIKGNLQYPGTTYERYPYYESGSTIESGVYYLAPFKNSPSGTMRSQIRFSERVVKNYENVLVEWSSVDLIEGHEYQFSVKADATRTTTDVSIDLKSGDKITTLDSFRVGNYQSNGAEVLGNTRVASKGDSIQMSMKSSRFSNQDGSVMVTWYTISLVDLDQYIKEAQIALDDLFRDSTKKQIKLSIVQDDIDKVQSLIDKVIRPDKKKEFQTILNKAQDIMNKQNPAITAEELTDNITLLSSTTLKGKTNPEALVRLSNDKYFPIAELNSDSNKEKEKYTMRADTNGNFEYKLSGGNHFVAGDKITINSYINGKRDTKEQIVLDKTAPKGESKNYHIVKGEAKPDAKVFVQNPIDTNPVPQDFTYKYTEETLSKIDTLVNTIGEHEVKVILMDNALNETIVTSTLIVHETKNLIEAGAITLETKIIKDMSETQIKEQILLQSKAKASKLVDGDLTDLTDKIQVTDLAGLSSSKTSGTYPVILTVKAADSGLATDITKVVQVTVKLSEQNVKVRFVDEAGETLSTTVTVKGNVGSTIDLTKEKQVIDTIASVLTNRYILEKSGRPTNETAVPVGMEESTITYTFQGTLSIYSGPTEINFGTHEVSWKGTKDNNPSYDQPLVIWDNRKNLSNWKLSVKLESELSMPSSPTHVLSGSLSYQTISDKKILSTEAQDVLQAKHDTSGQYDISTRTWGPDKQGLRLDVPSGGVKLTGEYETTLVWRVEEVY